MIDHYAVELQNDFHFTFFCIICSFGRDKVEIFVHIIVLWSARYSLWQISHSSEGDIRGRVSDLTQVNTTEVPLRILHVQTHSLGKMDVKRPDEDFT